MWVMISFAFGALLVIEFLYGHAAGLCGVLAIYAVLGIASCYVG